MKKKVFSIIALLLVAIMVLSSCKTNQSAATLTDAALAEQKLIDFANGANPDVLFESDGWSNGDVFNVVWKKANVKYEDGLMKLGITEEKATAWLDDKEVSFDYTAGEARTQNYYHYGDYEVSMKPSANGGTASTFFVCTGPYDTKFVLDENGKYKLDENGQPITVANPHDEIDIEFLGKDTTKVQFNYFVNGVGGHEYMHDLGFDAAEGFHEYGFRWAPDSITWFVDNVPVYKVTTDKSVTPAKNVVIVDVLPSTPGRILTNYWCGNLGAVGWMGQYKGNQKDNGTEYKWISTSATGAPLNPAEKQDDPVVPNDGIDWNAIAAVAPTFGSTDVYNVTNSGTSSHVTYSNVGGSSYINVEMDITDASAGKNYVHLTVTNNGTEMANVRVNLVDSALVDKGAQNMSTNQSATMDGETVWTDLVWGGSFFEIPAGKTVELVIHFNGAVERLQLMLDSSRNDAGVYAGDITVDNIKFAKLGEIVLPEPDPTDPVTPTNPADPTEPGTEDPKPTDPVPTEPKPEDPVTGDRTMILGGKEITWDGNINDGYALNANDSNNTLNVRYTAIVGNSYKNFWANVAAQAANKNIFSVKVKNNGTVAVRVRIDIESQTQVNANTTACNLSATQDGQSVFTDLEWGGSSFVIEPGATAVLEVTYDASKLPTNVKIFVDSHQYDDTATHAGNITFSSMTFKGSYDPQPEPTEPKPTEPKPTEPTPTEPKPTEPAPTEPAVDPLLSFSAEPGTGYEIANGTDGSVNVKYNGPGNTWKPITAYAADLAAGKNAFHVTVKNNGTADARVRFDVQGTTWVATGDGSGTDACNVSATGGDIWTDLTWGGSTLTVPAGQSVDVVVIYNCNGAQGAVKNILVYVDSARGDGNTYSADITLSAMAFDGEAPSGGDEPQQPQGQTLTFVTGSYNITPNNQPTDRLDVTYDSVAGGTYQNVCANIADIAAGNDTFTMTVKNNGSASVHVRIDIKATNTVGNTNVCNQSSSDGSWTDLEWGGTFVDVAPGAEVTMTIRYDATGAFGPATELLVYFDTSTYGDTNTYSGNLTISGFSFSKAG